MTDDIKALVEEAADLIARLASALSSEHEARVREEEGDQAKSAKIVERVARAMVRQEFFVNDPYWNPAQEDKFWRHFEAEQSDWRWAGGTDWLLAARAALQALADTGGGNG